MIRCEVLEHTLRRAFACIGGRPSSESRIVVGSRVWRSGLQEGGVGTHGIARRQTAAVRCCFFCCIIAAMTCGKTHVKQQQKVSSAGRARPLCYIVTGTRDTAVTPPPFCSRRAREPRPVASVHKAHVHEAFHAYSRPAADETMIHDSPPPPTPPRRTLTCACKVYSRPPTPSCLSARSPARPATTGAALHYSTGFARGARTTGLRLRGRRALRSPTQAHTPPPPPPPPPAPRPLPRARSTPPADRPPPRSARSASPASPADPSPPLHPAVVPGSIGLYHF